MPIEARVEQLERTLQNQSLVELLTQLQALQQEVQRLQGMVEEQGHVLEGVKNRQRDLYLDIDRRMGNLERQGVAGGGQGALNASAPPAVPVTPALAEAADPAQEQALYQEAFTHLKEARYEQAIAAFKDYLGQYPNGKFLDNAHYWLGESYYATRQFDPARQHFGKVEANRDSAKRADAMLKLGYSHYEIKEWEQARALFEALITQYPGTTAERLAKKRLQDMTQAGH
ncbi:MAG: tol-pal system protein YbgF [Gammaproteobacteria bacterium RBG_16_57_12]|nr:MAG: tol-pal system protein YbgF [Gammaproteobacteria bacterium RBG_16_57_12]